MNKIKELLKKIFIKKLSLEVEEETSNGKGDENAK
jgi:hypothetical protein